MLIWFCAALAAALGCRAQSKPVASAGEILVYAVSIGETGRYPRLERTEIFAVDPQAGKSRLIFSDAGLDFLLLPAYTGSGEERLMASAGGRIFARGFERKLYTGGWPTFPAGVYELSTDGSNRARKLFDVEGENGSSNFRNLFLSPSGAKIGHINYLGAKPYLFLHETTTGKLLRKTDLGGITLDCFVREIGWMPDGERLFFTLETGDADMTSEESYARAGSYVIKEDGSMPVRLGRDVAGHPQRPGYRPLADLEAELLGELPDSRYLFREYQQKVGSAGGGPARTFLYAVDAATKMRKDFPITAQGNLTSFLISPSGRALAFTEVQRQNETATLIKETQTVWVLDLETSQERKVFSLSSKPMALPRISLTGWLGESQMDVR